MDNIKSFFICSGDSSLAMFIEELRGLGGGVKLGSGVELGLLESAVTTSVSVPSISLLAFIVYCPWSDRKS